ncbi:hypothetical protein SDJN03_28340, partial [Cucurbita argyrosperma subsp. sororia]
MSNPSRNSLIQVALLCHTQAPRWTETEDVGGGSNDWKETGWQKDGMSGKRWRSFDKKSTYRPIQMIRIGLWIRLKNLHAVELSALVDGRLDGGNSGDDIKEELIGGIEEPKEVNGGSLFEDISS